MKLLLIEDNAAVQATLKRSFERRGFQVAGCDDGARALDRWHASQPDVVWLDLSLPGRDGLQVLSQARAEGLATPVIVLTARGTVGDRILGLNSGADDYPARPFDLDELEARVQALVRRGAGRAGGVGQNSAATDRNLAFDWQVQAATVQGHAWALRELVRNLLHNAIKQSPPGAALGVRLVQDGREATLTIADSSPGIADALRPQLMQPFAMGAAAPGNAPLGAGLGLAICHQIVHSLGGRLALDNRVVQGRVAGPGATVRLALAAPLPDNAAP